MGYSSDALKLRRPRTIDLPRGTDRLSFLYLDRARIWQGDTAVVVTDDDGETTIPAASIGVLLLGPGTSITIPALNTLHRAGCSIITTSDAGAVGIAAARPLTSRARWAEAQARLSADTTARLAAARTLYELRWPDLHWPDNTALNVMRGVEGRLVRNAYQQAARRQKLGRWRRQTDPNLADDPVNPLLNLANSVLYGAALVAVNALGLNPALGIIHQGAAGALLYDLADHDKHRASIPIAFEVCRHPTPERKLRTQLRHYLHTNRVIDRHLHTLATILQPHLHDDQGDRLIDSEHGTVPGHTNHAEH